MAAPKRTEARLREILKRQVPDRFGEAYLPAIRATPKEAPSSSRCTVLRSPRWEQRGIHLLSRQELKAGVLALYHPKLFDLHEQKILYPFAHPNPLMGLHATQQLILPDFRGTIDVCTRLGIERRHPTVYIGSAPDGHYLPFPYTGDLLLFLDHAMPRAVNWSIKVKNSDFTNRRRGLFATSIPNDSERAELDDRHRIEALYYLDAGITTHQIAGDDIDDQVFYNLQDLFDSLLDDIPLSNDDRCRASTVLRKAVGTKTPGYVVLDEIQRLFGLTRSQTSSLARQEIWHRRVRIDLFQPFDRARPLRPETRDVLNVYSRWFVER